jgi:hypothetical protein
MRWVERIARMWMITNAYKIVVGKLEHLGDLEVDGMIILK